MTKIIYSYDYSDFDSWNSHRLNLWIVQICEKLFVQTIHQSHDSTRSLYNIVRELWCSGSCSRLVIPGSWVQIPLGMYALRQGILSTIVSHDPGVVSG